MKLIVIDNIPTLMCLLTVIIHYKKLQPKWLQLFLYFLIFILAADAGGALYSHYFKKSNHVINNASSFISFSFYFFIFYRAFKKQKTRIIVLISFFIYLILFLCDAFLINGFYDFNSYSTSVGSILIVFCSLLYFLWLFTADTLINYFKLSMFWIATGLLFFYAGSLVQNSLINYIIKNHLDPSGSFYHLIMITLNVFLYGSFIIGLLCNQVWRKTR